MIAYLDYESATRSNIENSMLYKSYYDETFIKMSPSEVTDKSEAFKCFLENVQTLK